MHHQMEEFGSALTVIELEFRQEFDKKGAPLEELKGIWKGCLREVAKEKNWVWTIWGCEGERRNRVCMIIGWDVIGILNDAEDGTSSCEYVLSNIKSNGQLSALALLSPHLSSTPHTHTILTKESLTHLPNAGGELNACDIIFVQTPSTGSTHDIVEGEMQQLSSACHEIYWDWSGQSLADLRTSAFGISSSNPTSNPSQQDSNPVTEISTCTFILLLDWKSPEDAARFKDPGRESMRVGDRKMRSDWWVKEVEDRMAVLERKGAEVKMGSFNLNTWLMMFGREWSQPVDANVSVVTDADVKMSENESENYKSAGCGKCCVM